MIRFQRVAQRYPGADEVLRDISFTVEQGQMVFLTGPSGAGKTTLFKLIALLARPSRGDIVVDGVNLVSVRHGRIPAYRRKLGLIFQNPHLLPERTVFDNVALPLLIRGHSGADIGRRVRAALDAVGLLGRERAYPPMLSGGEQQRASIARAVVTRPALLLADEPTGNLDPAMAAEVMQLFLRFNAVGVSVLVASHAIGLIHDLPCPVWRLDKGRLRHGATAATAEQADG
ncbi:MAG: ATP-binding cassette domain-containing protein [Gammaproteobacteria bacterium]|nr:ATP-binding cassette domain-containing protein [Gammaproteobacteria bacterium]